MSIKNIYLKSIRVSVCSKNIPFGIGKGLGRLKFTF